MFDAQAPDVDELLELLEPIFSRDEIVFGTIGPVIGTHAGPRTIGVGCRPLAAEPTNPRRAQAAHQARVA